VIAVVGALVLAPAVALTASPPHVTLVGPARQTVRVANPARTTVVVDVTRAGFTLGPRGRPRLPPAAGSWLVVRPRRVVVPAGGAVSLAVSAAVPRGAPPGDHTAVVLLTSHPVRAARVAVRMRIGITVAIRVPGRIVHALAVGRPRVRAASGGAQVLEVPVLNRGNVVEQLPRGRLRLAVVTRGRVVQRLRPGAREVLPHSTAVFVLRCRPGLRGRLTAVVDLGGRRRLFSLWLGSTSR
jgi:hypothetical protein